MKSIHIVEKFQENTADVLWILEDILSLTWTISLLNLDSRWAALSASMASPNSLLVCRRLVISWECASEFLLYCCNSLSLLDSMSWFLLTSSSITSNFILSSRIVLQQPMTIRFNQVGTIILPDPCHITITFSQVLRGSLKYRDGTKLKV